VFRLCDRSGWRSNLSTIYRRPANIVLATMMTTITAIISSTSLVSVMAAL
jgi:hypothetical protein